MCDTKHQSVRARMLGFRRRNARLEREREQIQCQDARAHAVRGTRTWQRVMPVEVTSPRDRSLNERAQSSESLSTLESMDTVASSIAATHVKHIFSCQSLLRPVRMHEVTVACPLEHTPRTEEN